LVESIFFFFFLLTKFFLLVKVARHEFSFYFRSPFLAFIPAAKAAGIKGSFPAAKAAGKEELGEAALRAASQSAFGRQSRPKAD